MATARSVLKAALPRTLRKGLRRQVAALNRWAAPESGIDSPDLDFIATAPTEMSIEERLFLYALVRGHRPERVLEIGTSQGGSALIATGLEHNRLGMVVTVDPMPRIEIDRGLFHGRLEVVAGSSPEAVAEAYDLAGGPFDLVLVDGIHVYDQVRKDIDACLPRLADRCYLLFHDAFHLGVSRAIVEAVGGGRGLHDCGYVCNTPRIIGDTLTHGGFRLLRQGDTAVDAAVLLGPVYTAAFKTPPTDPDLINHDIYYCKYVKPCPVCERNGEVIV